MNEEYNTIQDSIAVINESLKSINDHFCGKDDGAAISCLVNDICQAIEKVFLIAELIEKKTYVLQNDYEQGKTTIDVIDFQGPLNLLSSWIKSTKAAFECKKGICCPIDVKRDYRKSVHSLKGVCDFNEQFNHVVMSSESEFEIMNRMIYSLYLLNAIVALQKKYSFISSFRKKLFMSDFNSCNKEHIDFHVAYIKKYTDFYNEIEKYFDNVRQDITIPSFFI